MLISRGGIPRPTGIFPESLSQAILVGIILVGRLGVVYDQSALQDQDTLVKPLQAWHASPRPQEELPPHSRARLHRPVPHYSAARLHNRRNGAKKNEEEEETKKQEWYLPDKAPRLKFDSRKRRGPSTKSEPWCWTRHSLGEGFVLSQLGGEGMREMQGPQETASEEAYKEHLLKQMCYTSASASHSGTPGLGFRGRPIIFEYTKV